MARTDHHCPDALARTCVAILKRLAASGFAVPIMLLVADGKQGYIDATRWDGSDRPPVQLALHPEGETVWQFPIHIFFISATGELVRAVVPAPDVEPELIEPELMN